MLQIVAGPVSDSDGSDDWYQISSGRSTTGWSPGRYLVSTVSTHDTDDGQRTFVAKVTAYSDGVDGIPVNARTASGTRTRYGVVAVDPKFISVGSSLSIEGYDGVFVAEDIGGGLKGPAIDIWLPDPSEARRYGTQSRRVTVLREGPPK
ncbi:MAG: hypothetical protein IT305_28155 [Chloroflexi bacterium]|nr:hypothetical protein [Chloroflexota bacterium]